MLVIVSYSFICIYTEFYEIVTDYKKLLMNLISSDCFAWILISMSYIQHVYCVLIINDNKCLKICYY